MMPGNIGLSVLMHTVSMPATSACWAKSRSSSEFSNDTIQRTLRENDMANAPVNEKAKMTAGQSYKRATAGSVNNEQPGARPGGGLMGLRVVAHLIAHPRSQHELASVFE